ncbi:MAG TPA: hypothetical protein VHU42_07205 [Rhodopila sp.]|nr:hypothetical protein [Rhodopila sp.]
MRFVRLVLATCLLAGCAGGLAQRQAELAHWVGQPEAQLIGAMGAPHRVFESGGTKFLTYEEIHVQRQPNGPYYFGPGPAAPSGFWGETTRQVCDTTFAVAGGVVKSASLRGNGCG